MHKVPVDFINEQKIWEIIEANKKPDFGKIKEILGKASEMKGLNLSDVAAITSISDPEMLSELFTTANNVKETIYGKRLVIFAPLYISNLCPHLSCATRLSNFQSLRFAEL